MGIHESMASFRMERQLFEEKGAYVQDSVIAYATDELKRNYLAMDAQPALTTDPNSGVPWFLQNLIDPTVYRILFAPNKAAEIIGEIRKGTWTDRTIMFPVVESVGEVSSYGDHSESGKTTANANWPTRQAYLFQTIIEYGEWELDAAGLGRINWVAELNKSVAVNLSKFSNLSYFFGIQGLANYGLLNDPNLSASLTPSTKAMGGVKWYNAGQFASATEIFDDIQSLYLQLVTQTNGLVQRDSEMILALSNNSDAALASTNAFGLTVMDALTKNFPKLKVMTAIQYEQITATNPQGIAAGNLVQLIAKSLEGQETGFCAFNEKMRQHKIIQAMSSFRQKITAGTWGTVLRMPVAISSMVGV